MRWIVFVIIMVFLSACQEQAKPELTIPNGTYFYIVDNVPAKPIGQETVKIVFQGERFDPDVVVIEDYARFMAGSSGAARTPRGSACGRGDNLFPRSTLCSPDFSPSSPFSPL